jgi:hypothetical protein
VLPAVTEVVVVAEHRAVRDQADGDRAGITELVHVLDVAVTATVDVEQRQVRVLPPHGRLEQAVQVAQRRPLGDEDAAPHRRADVPERDGELDGGHRLGRGGRLLVQQGSPRQGDRGRRRRLVPVAPRAENTEAVEDRPRGVPDGEERGEAVERFPRLAGLPTERVHALGDDVLRARAAGRDPEKPEHPGDPVGLRAAERQPGGDVAPQSDGVVGEAPSSGGRS